MKLEQIELKSIQNDIRCILSEVQTFRLPLEIRVAELSNSLENKSRYVWGKGNPQV